MQDAWFLQLKMQQKIGTNIRNNRNQTLPKQNDWI